MYQALGPAKPFAPARRRRPPGPPRRDVGVARHVGRLPAPPNQPPSRRIAAVARRLAAAARVALAEQRLHGCLGWPRTPRGRVEVLLVVELVVPLPDRVASSDTCCDRPAASSSPSASRSARYGTHRLATPRSARGGGWRAPDHRGCPSRGRPTPPLAARAHRAARSCRRRSPPSCRPRRRGRRSNGRSRACRARRHESRGRRSTGSWCRQLIDSSGQPCTNTISGASSAPHDR